MPDDRWLDPAACASYIRVRTDALPRLVRTGRIPKPNYVLGLASRGGIVWPLTRPLKAAQRLPTPNRRCRRLSKASSRHVQARNDASDGLDSAREVGKRTVEQAPGTTMDPALPSRARRRPLRRPLHGDVPRRRECRRCRQSVCPPSARAGFARTWTRGWTGRPGAQRRMRQQRGCGQSRRWGDAGGRPVPTILDRAWRLASGSCSPRHSPS